MQYFGYQAIFSDYCIASDYYWLCPIVLISLMLFPVSSGFLFLIVTPATADLKNFSRRDFTTSSTVYNTSQLFINTVKPTPILEGSSLTAQKNVQRMFQKCSRECSKNVPENVPITWLGGRGALSGSFRTSGDVSYTSSRSSVLSTSPGRSPTGIATHSVPTAATHQQRHHCSLN